ncbi:MAG: hypothetical protein ABRQ24_10195 [Syntrophomonadaceae bacterium]
MDPMDQNAKRLYDSLANLIVNLHLQKDRLSREEMYCLLSVLDMTLLDKEDQGLVQVLREWQAGEPNPEIDEIIKATLLNIDFAKPSALAANVETIRELIRYNEKLGDTRGADEPPPEE